MTLPLGLKESEKTLLSLDPGKTTGAALFKYEAEDGRYVRHVLLRIWTISFEDIFKWLNENVPDYYVVEDYKVRPRHLQKSGYAHQWDDGKTLRIIGFIEGLAQEHGVTIKKVQPSDKPLAYRLINKEYKKGKPNMHMWDAMAHGEMFFHRWKGGLLK